MKTVVDAYNTLLLLAMYRKKSFVELVKEVEININETIIEGMDHFLPEGFKGIVFLENLAGKIDSSIGELFSISNEQREQILFEILKNIEKSTDTYKDYYHELSDGTIEFQGVISICSMIDEQYLKKSKAEYKISFRKAGILALSGESLYSISIKPLPKVDSIFMFDRFAIWAGDSGLIADYIECIIKEKNRKINSANHDNCIEEKVQKNSIEINDTKECSSKENKNLSSELSINDLCPKCRTHSLSRWGISKSRLRCVRCGTIYTKAEGKAVGASTPDRIPYSSANNNANQSAQHVVDEALFIDNTTNTPKNECCPICRSQLFMRSKEGKLIKCLICGAETLPEVIDGKYVMRYDTFIYNSVLIGSYYDRTRKCILPPSDMGLKKDMRSVERRVLEDIRKSKSRCIQQQINAQKSYQQHTKRIRIDEQSFSQERPEILGDLSPRNPKEKKYKKRSFFS